jgi:hypothetical protein
VKAARLRRPAPIPPSAVDALTTIEETEAEQLEKAIEAVRAWMQIKRLSRVPDDVDDQLCEQIAHAWGLTLRMRPCRGDQCRAGEPENARGSRSQR